MGSIRRHKHAMSALLAEYIDKDDIAATRPIDEVKRFVNSAKKPYKCAE